MKIEFGSVEYFELLSFQDRLKGYRLDNLDLHHLDLLRVEVARKIGAINLAESNRKELIQKRKDEAWDSLGTTLLEGEESGEGV